MNERVFNHYGQKNENNYIVYFFSDAFIKPDINSVLYKENGGRHCRISAVDNDSMFLYKDKNGKIEKLTSQELLSDYREERLNYFNRFAQREIQSTLIKGFDKLVYALLLPTEAERKASLEVLQTKIDALNSKARTVKTTIQSMTYEELKEYKTSLTDE